MGKTINTILNLTDKFTPKLTEAGKQTLIFKEQLKNCNSAANNIDSSLAKLAKTAAAVSAAGVMAVSAFATSSLNTYKDFEQSMSNVAGILAIDQTSETYEKLEKAAREAGASTSKNAQQSADALSYMALAGWSVEESMEGLMPILRASEATGSDLATTSDLITDSMSALGVEVKDLNDYLDVCARAQNKSNTTLTQMQEAYIKVGGTFKTFNTELPESAALLGIIANRGIKGAEAGNKLQSTLVNLTKKSGESYDAMQALGISAYDSEGKFKGVTNTLLELNEKTKDLTEEQRNNYFTMIGGKEQLTTLNALMSGLTNTMESGKTEYEELYAEVSNADGALDKMATTMTDNYAGAIEQASGALDELKLTIGERLEPYVSNFLNWFADSLPEATEKFATVLDNKIPKAVNFCKQAFDKIKPVVSFITDNFAELASAGAGVVVGLEAFSIMTKIASFAKKLEGSMKGLTTAQKLATIAQTAFNTSLLANPITLIAAAIGTAVGGILAWKKHMEKADIEKHFGDITLNAEECAEIVKGVFGSEVLEQADEAAEAYEQLRSSLDDVTASARKLDKLNFKIEFGGDVSKEDYMSAVDEYIANLQDAVKDKQYSLSLNIDLLFDNSEFGNAFAADANNYYGQLSADAAKLGEDLKAAVEDAYNHNWDLDSTEAVAEIMKQQSEIQEKIATAQSEAKLETLKLDFASGDLSQESFQNLINATTEELDKLEETYNQARIDAIAQAKLMYGDGSAELEKAIQEANSAYSEKMAGLQSTGLKFENDAIMSAYSEEFTKLAQAMGESFDTNAFFTEINKKLAEGGEIDVSELVSLFETGFEGVIADAGISDAARKHIGELYEMMMPTVEDMQKAIQGMDNVPETYANVFIQSSMIGAVSKNAEALKNTGVTALSTVVPEDTAKILESSKEYGDAFVKGIQSNENIKNTENAAEKLRSTLKDALSKPISVSIPISTNTTGNNPSQPSTPTVDSNAVGTTYFGGGFTRINENGGEIINLPTGTTIIPADKSEKMVQGGQNVNVTVQVMGNIFGTQEAVDIIGEEVCSRIVSLVGAM